MNDLRERIKSAYFIDQMQLQQGPQMTATEVLQRTEENLRLMGPVLGRQLFEFARPTLSRVFDIMMRKKKFPEPPEALQGQDFEFNFTSQIVRAQKLNQSQNLLRAIESAGPLIEADPSVLDNINSDEALRHIIKLHGLPQQFLRSQEEIEGLREQRAEAQEKEEVNQQELMDAEKVQKAGPTLAQAL